MCDSDDSQGGFTNLSLDEGTVKGVDAIIENEVVANNDGHGIYCQGSVNGSTNINNNIWTCPVSVDT